MPHSGQGQGWNLSHCSGVAACLLPTFLREHCLNNARGWGKTLVKSLCPVKLRYEVMLHNGQAMPHTGVFVMQLLPVLGLVVPPSPWLWVSVSSFIQWDDSLMFFWGLKFHCSIMAMHILARQKSSLLPFLRWNVPSTLKLLLNMNVKVTSLSSETQQDLSFVSYTIHSDYLILFKEHHRDRELFHQT